MPKFKKGESGNPGGRPKMSAEARKAFEKMEPEALKTLQLLLSSDDERIQLEAWKAWADRRMGKPVQATENTELGANGEPLKKKTLLVEFVDPGDEDLGEESDEAGPEDDTSEG